MLTERSAPAFAFISLLRDGTDARALSGLLEGLALSEASAAATFLVPEVRGLDFFAAEHRQVAVDDWWSRHVPGQAVPVYLLAHEAGLPGWLRGLDGRFLVVADQAAAAEYPDAVVVRGEAASAALALAEAAVVRFGGLPGGDQGLPEAAVFDSRDAAMIARIRSEEAGAVVGADSGVDAACAPAPAARAPGERDAPAAWKAVPQAPALLELDGAPPLRSATALAVAGVGQADPIDLLVAESAQRERLEPIWPAGGHQRGRPAAGLGAPGVAGKLATLARRPRLARPPGRDRAATVAAELAALLLSRPGRVVVVGSRKGGVGKTSHAAGMAIAAGTVLDTVGHVAALVDANIANPDAWGQLRLPEHAATVRDVVTALAGGVPPPPPVHATTPALACYPERREGAEYGRTDIRRLAAHLRAHHALVIVDMSNRLPDPTGGPEAAVASHWLDEADALVLPTAMSRQDFNGVLDYLDVGGLPPVVVPCIVSGARRNRRHPMTREYLETIAARVDRVIEVPDEADRVRLAGMDGVPVQQVSAKMRDSYREMLLAVARLPVRPGR